jgi:Ni/Co efflux regulator RcnB
VTLTGIGASIDARSFINCQGTVMKFLPKIVLVLTAAASCAAGAATALTPQADQERRDRNREEALAAYHASPEGRSYGNASYHDDSVTAKVKHAEDDVVTKTKQAGNTVAAKTDQATKPVRDFTHRQLDKSREFEARQNQRYGKAPAPEAHGDAAK